jgi:transposase
MDKITAVGLDLAKQIIQVHGIDVAGRVVLRKAVRRERLLALLVQLPRCVVGMEACSGAHHWARELKKLGHEPRIMAAEFVRPFRKSLAAKNDANDAEAICTAVAQPNMRFVSIKSVEQQALLSLHRVRQGLIEERTASINRLRGVLAEFGLVLPQSVAVSSVRCPRCWLTRGGYRLWCSVACRRCSNICVISTRASPASMRRSRSMPSTARRRSA